ncbi:hypothetical protein HG1285_15451 [Hydrogenivirga sp. 128-5-R1-1]|nr:hypothetical protein HG1285_15451 [Hydrogenivirga sp. 128-5-R1-1]
MVSFTGYKGKEKKVRVIYKLFERVKGINSRKKGMFLEPICFRSDAFH